jgi:hypothetical protein
MPPDPMLLIWAALALVMGVAILVAFLIVS